MEKHDRSDGNHFYCVVSRIFANTNEHIASVLK